MIRICAGIFSALLLLVSSCTSVRQGQKVDKALGEAPTPKNIILMIVDGMGFEYVKAARIYNGQTPLSYENFPCKTHVTTCAYEGAKKGGACINNSEHVTDSAAAATAIATGVKVSNGVISKSIPGAHTHIQTILEIAKTMNKSTGIVVTKLFSDATPAAFVSHADNRNETEVILESIFKQTTPNLILGADNSLHKKYAESSVVNYEFVHKASDLKKLSEKIAKNSACKGHECPHIYGGFGQHAMIANIIDKDSGLPLEIMPAEKFGELDVPHLADMTEAALKILNKNSNGFFLMIESSLPDSIGHCNEQFDENDQTPSAITVLVREMIEVEHTVNILQDFVAKNPDTLVILTADHETGGLVIEDHKTDCLGELHCLASVRWTSEKYDPNKKDSGARHTGVSVPLYAIGAGAERFCKDSINNTDIKNLALGINASN